MSYIAGPHVESLYSFPFDHYPTSVTANMTQYVKKPASNRIYNIQQIIQPNLPQIVQKLPSYGIGKVEELPAKVTGN